jgi:SAM-dependent methyltransferase
MEGAEGVKFCSGDFSNFDADFILHYTTMNSEILDLGSGTGLIVNKLYDKIKHIVAIEPIERISSYIIKNEKTEIVNKTIMDYFPIKQFDLITLFGIMQYFNEQEAVEVYKKYYPVLKNEGKIIIKNQFGVCEDVIVNGYSEELKTNYYSQYRHVDKEIVLLETIGFKNIEIIDIYPPECNRWDNTHFYAIVAKK